MKTQPLLTGLLPSFVAAGIIITAFSASSATNMIHRYSFNEPPGATAVIDSIRGSNGVPVSTPAGTVPSFDGTKVTLDGAGGYIDLPNRMLSGLTNVTFEFWVTYASGGTWARLLDFGFNANGEDTDGTKAGAQGSNYVFITLEPGPRFAITPASNGNENQMNSSTPVTPGPDEHHVVVAYGPARTPSMYVDGNFVGSGTHTHAMSTITNDVNCWLGRSQWADPFFGGSFNEFRMHSTMLGQLEVLASRAAGPNTINYTPENPTSITLNVNSNMNSGQFQDATITGVFPTYGTVTVGAAEATLTSSASGIVRVGGNNQLTAVAPGTATITASLGGQTSMGSITVVPPVVAVNQLKHRYSFNETAGSTTANDSVGTAHATVVPPLDTTPPVVISNGMANFPGGGNNARATCGYITFPSGMLTTEFTNITVEFWFTWNGGTDSTWQRVFDFGDSLKGDDAHINNNGRDYITFTPQRGGDGARTEFRATLNGGANYTSVFNDAAPMGPAPGFPTGREVHVVCTVAPGINYSALYVDGRVQNINTTPVIDGVNAQLSQVSSPNMWLGVSQWFDPPLNGRINEMRLHEGLQSEVQIALSRQAGPDTLPVSNPGTLQSVALQVSPLFIGNTIPAVGALLANFQNVSNVDVTPLTGSSLQSTDTNIFTVVSATGAMTPVSLGTASLIGTYNSMSATSEVSVLAPTSVSVTNLPATLDVGDPATTTYTVPLLAGFPGGISNVNVTAFTGVTRSSSDTNVATITAAGVITVLNPGSTTITSTYSGQSVQATLTVLAPISVSVTNLPATRDAGSLNFAVPLLAAYSDGHTNINVSAATGVVRTSSDPNVATISGGGTVTVRNPGVTTITSSYRGLTHQSTLTVVMPANFVRGTLVHRYSFSEAADTGTVDDSVGTADGTVVSQQLGQANGNFTGAGEFLFGPGPYQEPPVTNAYINLPNGLISGLSSVTIEGWFTWFGGTDNQRIFDFGMSSGAPDGSGGTSSTNYLEDFVLNPGRAYFFLSPQVGRPRFAMKREIDTETPSVQSPTTITITASNKSHFAIVYDQPRGVVRLYVNGQRAGTAAATLPLSVVDDRNNWLGRSQWQDPYFNGSIDEFRIYGGPFLDSDIADNFATGPNSLPVPKVALSAVTVGGNLQLSWSTNVPPGVALQATPTLDAGKNWSGTGLPAPVVVGDKWQVTVPTSGNASFYRLAQ